MLRIKMKVLNQQTIRYLEFKFNIEKWNKQINKKINNT